MHEKWDNMKICNPGKKRATLARNSQNKTSPLNDSEYDNSKDDDDDDEYQ